MAYTMEVNDNERYITVVTDGELTIKDIGVFGREFVKKEQETGIRKVLIDIRKSRIKAGFIDAFTYTANSYIPILSGEKNAILYQAGSPDALKAKIYALQSMLSGLHVRIFTSEKQALEWLLL